MMRFLTTFVVAAAAMSFTQAASAQETAAPNKAQELFAQVDTNHDNVISIDEWKAAGRRERGYAFVDTNKDGKVMMEELRAAAAKRGQ